MVENPPALGSREHVCVLHRGPAEREALLGALITSGVQNGDKCLFVTDDGDAERLTRRFPASEHFTLLPSSAYLTDGRFLPAKAAARWDELLGAYVAAGYDNVRAGGELSWWVGRKEPAGALFEYEEHCDALARRHPTAFFCFYDLDRFGGRFLPGLLRHHPAALVRQVLFRAGDSETRWQLGGPDAAGERLAMAALLLAGCSAVDEVADMVSGVVLAALPLDFVAVVTPEPDGRWRARGLAGDRPLDSRLAGRLAARAGRTGGVPVAGDGGFTAHPFPDGSGSLVLGSTDPLAGPEAARFVQALTVLAAAHLDTARRYEAGPLPLPAGIPAAAEVTRELLDGGGDEDAAHHALAYGVDLANPARVAVVRHSGRASVLRKALADRGFRLLAGRPGEIAAVVGDDGRLDLALGPVGPAGVGGAFVGTEDCPRSYRQAVQAAEMAVRLGRPVLRHEDLGLLRMLAAGGDPASVEEFVAGRLGPLLEHDSERGGELVATLAAYLDSGANQLATAKALGIHVNTLKYRLGRIEEVATVDLSDPDARFHLQLALMAQRSLETLARPTGSSNVVKES